MPTILSRLLDLTVAIQQIPAPTFNEGPRAEFIRGQFLKAGLSEVEMDAAGNVYACHRSGLSPLTSSTGPLVVSAHLDTVFPPATELTLDRQIDRITGPGIGDNATGVAGLIGLVWVLRERGIALHRDLWLVGNVCEEGLGDLRGMKAVVERFGSTARAYIVLEGMALGQVYNRGLGVRRYRINVRTSGGHSWIDYGQPSAVHELTNLVSKLTALSLPREPRTTLNVGTIAGGTSVNTIAAEAGLELDLRSEQQETLETVVRQVEELVETIRRPGVEIEVKVIGQRPGGEIPAEHPLIQTALECLRAQHLEPRLNIGSTDANWPLSLGLPAVTIGLTTGKGGHTTHEYINTQPLEKGLDQLAGVVTAIQ